MPLNDTWRLWKYLYVSFVQQLVAVQNAPLVAKMQTLYLGTSYLPS